MKITTEENVIHINPIFTWDARLLPTKAPVHRSQEVTIGNRNSAKGFIQEITITSTSSSLYLLIGLVLFISAIVWSITHLLIPFYCKKIFRSKTRKIKKTTIYDKDILLENFKENDLKARRIDQLFLTPIDKYVQSDNVSVTLASMKQSQTMDPNKTTFQSSAKIRELESLTSNSLCSFQTGLLDNQFIGHDYLRMSSTRSQIIELKKLELILTISGLRCPNSWMSKNGTKINHFEPSSFEECLEVFLLLQEKLLIGKLRNFRHKILEGEFVIQIWRTLDGILETFADSPFTCDAVCPMYDKFLVLLRQGEVLVWDLLSNSIIAKIVLQNSQLIKGRYSMQTTKNEEHIAIEIFYPSNETYYIYTCTTNSLISGDSSFKYKSYLSKKNLYSLTLENSIIIGSENNKLIIWNLTSDQERLLFSGNGELVQTILNSADGEIILLQSTDRISFWKTSQWSKLSDIFLLYNKICSMVISLKYGQTYLFAAALENGVIYIFDTSNGKLLKILQTKIPITYMVFSNYNHILITIADRASQYQLTLFNIQ